MDILELVGGDRSREESGSKENGQAGLIIKEEEGMAGCVVVHRDEAIKEKDRQELEGSTSEDAKDIEERDLLILRDPRLEMQREDMLRVKEAAKEEVKEMRKLLIVTQAEWEKQRRELEDRINKLEEGTKCLEKEKKEQKDKKPEQEYIRWKSV